MNDVKPLPESVVKSLSEAKITPEYEIFYEKGQWVYQRKQQKANGLERLNSLGPFDIHSVNIQVVLCRSTKTYIVTQIGDRKLSKENQRRGIYSPLAEITLEGFARTTANIPEQASHFCWLYPLFQDSIPNDLQFDSSDQFNVLHIGGFAYFRRIQIENEQEDLQLIQVNSLVVDGENGIVFDDPLPWRSEFTEQLWQEKRFQPVTLPELRAKGARYFAFINPNEAFCEDNMEMPWIPSPNGAFAYLYNDDHSAHVYDCYFAVADSCLGVSASDG